jgi:hypothetical protein
MALLASHLDETKAAFRTHLNYVRHLELLLSKCSLSLIGQKVTVQLTSTDIDRFKKLYEVTYASIKKDIELANKDPAFSVIAAPWFPVKCYYALYYLESILVHIYDGTKYGFGKGGHGGIRRKMAGLISAGKFVFSVPEINRPYTLQEILNMATIKPGFNARIDFWNKSECTSSIAKKLLDYKIHDQRSAQKWNLHTKKGRAEKQQFINKESLALLDFFYWYRIKANYRDLDYIDFENGISEGNVLQYLLTYNRAFELYRKLLADQISANI